MKEQKLVSLKRDYGIILYIIGEGRTINSLPANRNFVVYNQNDEPMLFQNREIAKLYAEEELGLTKNMYRMKIAKYDTKAGKLKVVCNFEDMQDMENGTYQYIGDELIYFIKPEYVSYVSTIRYFCFERGDENRTSKVYGRKRNKQLIHDIVKCLRDYFYNAGILAGIKIVSSDEVVVSFKKSTTKMHIMTNGLISNINKARKERMDESNRQFSRCIPFINELDKYTTIFSFTTKDIMEPEGFGFTGEIDQDVERVYEFIEDFFEGQVNPLGEDVDFKYIPVEFNGTILLKED